MTSETFLDIKDDFPILSRLINGKEFIYLDSAATTQKPDSVINSITNYYKNYNSNIHRGIYSISIEATEHYENARTNISHFIHAKSPNGISFH